MPTDKIIEILNDRHGHNMPVQQTAARIEKRQPAQQNQKRKHRSAA